MGTPPRDGIGEWTCRVMFRRGATGFLLCTVGLSGISCNGEGIQSPTTGSLVVVTATGGPEPDGDGYAVVIDGGAGIPVDVNATLDRDLTPGEHTLLLTGLAPHCVVEGENPRTVTVVGGGTASAHFAITCSTTAGSVSVAVTTTGASPDPDGYTLSVDGGNGQAIGSNETRTFTGLTTGSHEVELSGLADNCRVDGDNPRMVEVQAGNNAAVGFSVTCPAAAVPLIAFNALGGGGRSSSIYVVKPDGQGLTNLTPSGARDALPKWSPDRSRIAFFNIDTEDIWVMNADGSGRVNLTHSPERDFDFFVWSPDGNTIAFQINDPLDEPNMWTIRADGSGQTLLMPGGQLPDWSPDGSKIAFTMLGGGGNYQIYSIQSDGSGATMLTNGTLKNTEPDWSPDGSKIAFIRASQPRSSGAIGEGEIYVMNADGTGLVNLTNGRGIDTKPRWSPDGSRILFESSPGNSANDVYVMNADGTGRARLTDQGDQEPTWSPDGSKIAFSRHPIGTPDSEIYVMNADGSGLTDVSNHPTINDVSPSWAAW